MSRYESHKQGKLCTKDNLCDRCKLIAEIGECELQCDETFDEIKARLGIDRRNKMTSVFRPEAYQYDHAQVLLPKYLEKYADGEWELRSTVRKDTLHRCKLGLPVKKKVYLRKPKDIEVTHRQVELVLLAMNSRRPFNVLSRDILYCIDEMDAGFNGFEVALKMFGPSDKPNTKANHEQKVKQKVRKLEYNNVLLLLKIKYYKLPVWQPLLKMVREIDKTGKFERGMLW